MLFTALGVQGLVVQVVSGRGVQQGPHKEAHTRRTYPLLRPHGLYKLFISLTVPAVIDLNMSYHQVSLGVQALGNSRCRTPDPQQQLERKHGVLCPEDLQQTQNSIRWAP